MDRKGLIVVTIVAVLIVLGVVGYILGWGDFVTDHDTNDQGEGLAGQDLTHEEIAGNLISWLLDQQEESGVFSGGLICREATGCEDIVDYRVGAFPVWALSTYASEMDDEKSYDDAGEILEVYLDRDVIRPPQVYSWHCKLLLDVASIEGIPLKVKDLAEEYCLAGNNLDEIYDSVLEEYTFEDEFKPIFTDINSVGSDARFFSDQDYEIYKYSVKTSEFAERFLYWQEEEDRRRAAGYLQYALELLQAEAGTDEFISDGGKCVLGVGALDVYQITDEPEYLELSKSAVVNDTYMAWGLSDFSYCAFWARELYEETGEEKYLNLSEQMLETVIERYLDYEGYDGYVYGDGVFNTGTEKPYHKPLIENSLMVYNLLKNR